MYMQTGEGDKMRKEFDSELSSVNAWLELTTKTSKNVLPCTQQALLANLRELDVSLIFYLYSAHKDEVHVQWNWFITTP